MDAPESDNPPLPEGIVDRVVGPVSTLYLTESGEIVSVPHAQTEDERRALSAHLAQLAPKISEDIDRQVDELLDVLRPHNPLSVIAGVWLANSILDGDSFKEFEHRGNDAYTEYVAALYLTLPFGLGDGEGIEPLSGELFEDIQSRVEALFAASVAAAATSWIDKNDPSPPGGLDALAFRTRLEALAVRYPGYDVHLKRTLRGIFGECDSAIERTLGVSGTRAVDLCVALEALVEDRVNAQFRRAVDGIDGILESAKAQTPETLSDDASPFFRHLVSLPEGERLQPAQWAAMTWASTFMGFHLLFTADELASKAGTTLDEAEALLDLLSVGFGDVNPIYFRRPSSTSPLRSTPVVRLTPDEHEHVQGPLANATGAAYFCPVPNALLWALRPAVERALKPNGRDAHPQATKGGWNTYDEGRARYVESRAMELLTDLLPGASSHSSLTYPVPGEGGGQTAELDGLLALDDALVLVEAKAGALHEAARRGAKRTLKKDVREVLTVAHRQARRAQAYVSFATPPVFTLPDGGTYTVPSDATRVFLVAVTLEPLDAITSNSFEAEAADLFDVRDGSARDYPWAVSLYDLEIFADTLSRAAEFTHFLDRRLAVHEAKRVRAHGELDWLGRYLTQGLDFEEELSRRPGTQLNLLTYTTQFDDYYLYTYGGRRKPAPRPSQPTPAPLDEILEGFASAGNPGFLAASEMLLDVPHSRRAELAALAQHVRRTAQTERRYSDATGLQVGGSQNAPFGISFMAGPAGTDLDALQSRLIGYAKLKKYQSRADRWLGIGTIHGTPEWSSVAFTITGPWQFDPQLDALARRSLNELPEEVRSHPSVRSQSRTVRRKGPKNPRNQPCSCGSGKKTKHCDCSSAPS